MDTPSDGQSGLKSAVGSLLPSGDSGLSGATSLALIVATSVAVGILVFLTSWAAPLISPIALGLILTAIATPLFDRIEARGRNGKVAMVLTIVVLVIVGGGLALLSIYSSQQLHESLSLYADQLLARYPEASDILAPLGVAGGLSGLISPDTMVSALSVAAASIAEIGGNLAFAVVLAALLLLDKPRLSRLVGSGLGSGNPVFRQVPAIAQSAITYFTIRIRVNAITAAGLLVVMLVFGVDNAVLWAIGAFFLSFVPYVGLVLALIPPVILAFAESGLGAAAAIVIGGAILNVVAENVLEPSMTGKALHVTTWVVFVMFFFAVWLIGPVGSLLAMPLTVLIVLVLGANERTSWVAALLTNGDAPAPSPPEPVPARAN